MTENRNLQVSAEFVRRETVSFGVWLGAMVFVRRLDREVEASVRAHVGTALAPACGAADIDAGTRADRPGIPPARARCGPAVPGLFLACDGHRLTATAKE